MRYRPCGGRTPWKPACLPFHGAPAQPPECGSSPESYNAGDGSYRQGASDGSLWLLVDCGGATYLARSTDEASSFPILHRANGGAPVTVPFTAKPSNSGHSLAAALGSRHELRVDRTGNLYAFEVN